MPLPPRGRDLNARILDTPSVLLDTTCRTNAALSQLRVPLGCGFSLATKFNEVPPTTGQSPVYEENMLMKKLPHELKENCLRAQPETLLAMQAQEHSAC